MKSKIVFNILTCYFFVLIFVLLFQFSSKKISAVEPLSSKINAQDKLKNSVILYIGSPLTIVNEKQFLIDYKDSTLTPIIEDGKVYIPIHFMKTAFGANISFSKQTKETTVRLDNKAIVFYNQNNKISVIDILSEESFQLEENSKIINDRFYIPLRTFADIFKKDIFYNNNLIIISNMKDIFDPIEEVDLIENIIQNIKGLPIIGSEENLKEIISREEKSYSNNIHSKNESLNKMKKDNQDGLFQKIPNYNFYINENKLKIYNVNELKEEVLDFEVELLADSILEYANIVNNRLILSYSNLDVSTSTFVYDITNKDNIKILSKFQNNGSFEKNILNNNYLYSFSRLKVSHIGPNLPKFKKQFYTNGIASGYLNNFVSLDKISYFPDLNDLEFSLITVFNIQDNSRASEYVYFGMGDNIALVEDGIYIYTNKENHSNLYLFTLISGEIKYIKKVDFDSKITSVSFEDIPKFGECIKIYTKDLKEYILNKDLENVF